MKRLIGGHSLGTKRTSSTRLAYHWFKIIIIACQECLVVIPSGRHNSLKGELFGNYTWPVAFQFRQLIAPSLGVVLGMVTVSENGQRKWLAAGEVTMHGKYFSEDHVLVAARNETLSTMSASSTWGSRKLLFPCYNYGAKEFSWNDLPYYLRIVFNRE